MNIYERLPQYERKDHFEKWHSTEINLNETILHLREENEFLKTENNKLKKDIEDLKKEKLNAQSPSEIFESRPKKNNPKRISKSMEKI